MRTVIDCCRHLPFDEALAVADSALQDVDVSLADLMDAAHSSPRTGRSRVLRVLSHADPGSANSFESALRALCIEAGLEVEAQGDIGGVGVCDIVDRRRMLAIEGESFAYHGSEKAFEKDVRRYTAFGRRGWLVIRFTVNDVLTNPSYVSRVLSDVMACRPVVSARRLARA